MRICFVLNLKPFSINRVFSRDMRHKTADYRDWEISAVLALRSPSVQLELKKIREGFDAKIHGVEVSFCFNIPKTIMLNKAGQLSSRAMDLSNCEKTLLDILCLPKYHVQSTPYGAPNLNIDDKYVVALHSYKKISNLDYFTTTVKIKLKKL